jgi:isopentenyl-diphosphate delta-isomerase
MSIQNRKQDHVKLTAENQSAYSFDAGLDRWKLRHNALPELNLTDISITSELLSRNFAFPVMLSSMTGGYAGATQMNAIIARAAQRFNIPMGVGSQRAMLVDASQRDSFEVVRKVAPDAFIAGNIGGAQLIGGLPQAELDLLIESVRADALIVHLNPLQELMQAEGDRNFSGIIDGIKHLCQASPIPVMVKETGAGIDITTAMKLAVSGVRVIDIAGAGGTSWARVENLRQEESDARHDFDNWGLSTSDCLLEYPPKKERNFEVIASGGIRTPLHVLTALCLGADFTAVAQPVLAAIHQNGAEGLDHFLNRWQESLKIGLLLCGAANVNLLSQKNLIRLK